MSREMNRKIRLAEIEASARIWNIDTGKGLTLRGHSGYSELGTTNFSPDGKMVISADDNVVRTWDANTGRQLRTSKNIHADTPLSPDKKQYEVEGRAIIAHSPDGKRVITSHYDNDDGWIMRVWALP